MRVISGTARGKKLNTLSGLNTRPTLDRVKEAVFSIIQFELEDKEILDLFSGSGALAIESLSRGAKSAVLCDNSREAIRIIRQNIEETKLESKVEIINKDYIDALLKYGDFDFVAKAFKIYNITDTRFELIRKLYHYFYD